MSRASLLLRFCFSCSCEECHWPCWGIARLCHEALPEATAIMHSKCTDKEHLRGPGEDWGACAALDCRPWACSMRMVWGHSSCWDGPLCQGLTLDWSQRFSPSQGLFPEHLAKADEICREIDLRPCEWLGDICSWQNECTELGCELCQALPW